MSERHLTEAEWRKFSKGRGLKDSALVRALAALDKAEGPHGELDALQELQKQGHALRAANKGDQALAAYLGELELALQRQRRLSLARSEEEENREARRQEDGRKAGKRRQAEEDGPQKKQQKQAPDGMPPALSTGMVATMRRVRQGQVMNVWVGTLGTKAAVLVTRRPVRPAPRGLLGGYLGGRMPRCLPGTCLFEENAYTFVLKGKATGLARKVKAALKAQLGMQLRTRVRSDDPNDPEVDAEVHADDVEVADWDQPVAYGDGEDDDGLEDALAEGPGDAAGADDPLEDEQEHLRAGAADAGDGALAAQPAAMPTAADPAEAGFTARLSGILPRARGALAAGGPGAATLKDRLNAAAAAARRRDFGAADGLLDQALQLLDPREAGRHTGGEAVRQRLDEIQQRYLALLARDPADATRLRAVFGFARERLAAGQSAKAGAALDQLERLMADAAAPRDRAAVDGSAPGAAALVAYRRSLLQYRAASGEVRSRIAALRTAIAGRLPERQALADELASALDDYNDELLDLVDEAIHLADNPAAPVTRALAAQVESYLAHLATDPLVRHADANPFGIDLGIQDHLARALTEVRQAMPQPA